MNQKIDRQKVYWMLRTGWHPERIAERLDCSRRQVDRIKETIGFQPVYDLVDPENEQVLWNRYKDFGESFGKIALRFGRSRQAVQQYFNLN